jgi:excinuclease ABC subunit C
MLNATEHIQNILTILPSNPGVYQYYDADNKLIYVGKAKNLKKRVTSYFNKDHDSRKTYLLVKQIVDIKYIVVETEWDALLLENTLIKKNQPKYNINLKDDKMYPWIAVTREAFPRIFATRKKIPGTADYYGPYASKKMMYTLLDFIKELYPVRSCRLNLTEETIQKGKWDLCLEYHIGNCKAPCEAKQTKEDYGLAIAHIKEIIKGNISIVTKSFVAEMTGYAERMEFEAAQRMKLKLENIQHYQVKSTVVDTSIAQADVFSVLNEEKSFYVNYLKVIHGAIINSHTLEFKRKLDETPEDLLALAIVELRNQFNSVCKEIIVPFAVDIPLENLLITVPERGDKKKLLELSEKNVVFYKRDRDLQADLVDPERRTNELMQKMKKDLRMAEEPRRIDGFDNSNIQGHYAVSAMPVFINGKPAKKEYRHFNVKTVEGPDDFATMREIIHRRYKRVLEDKLDMPNLIVIDGGKGQLGAAIESLRELGLMGKVAIIGIAKRLEEIYFPGDPIPMYLDKKSETLRVIQHIRDEAHRFGITHHRNMRSKETFKSELHGIKGIGETTVVELIKVFKSVRGVKEATPAELQEVVGLARTKLITDYFANADAPSNNDEAIDVE